MTDVGRCRKSAIEVDTLDQRVRGQDLQRATLRRRDCRIVADTDHE